jgi:hypothetical protein
MSFFDERDLARWGREARTWLAADDRGRTIGLVILSVTVSIALSLAMTALVGAVSRRRAAIPAEVAPSDVGEPLADVPATAEEVVGVPVMGAEGAAVERVVGRPRARRSAAASAPRAGA